MAMNAANLILATINAPYSKQLDEGSLVACIWDFAKAKLAAGPVSSFYGEVPATLQKQFALEHGIPENVLTSAAKKFGEWSGQNYALAS
jgi:hypothetical protein